jgi:hypothetical protein
MKLDGKLCTIRNAYHTLVIIPSLFMTLEATEDERNQLALYALMQCHQMFLRHTENITRSQR